MLTTEELNDLNATVSALNAATDILAGMLMKYEGKTQQEADDLCVELVTNRAASILESYHG